MEFRGIRRLLTVVESGNFSVAARKLNISQPALTRSIQQLEFSYGVQLIERTAQGVKLSDIGKELEPFFREALKAGEKIRTLIKHSTSDRKKMSTFGVCVSFEESVVPLVISDLKSRYPSLDMHIHTGLTSFLVDKITSGAIDFALGLELPSLPHRNPEISYEKCIDDRLIIVARRGHPFAIKGRPKEEDIVSADWILPRVAGLTLPSFHQFFQKRGMSRPDHVITLDSVALTKATLMTSDFITLVSELGIHREIERRELAVIDAPNFYIETSVGVYFRAAGALSELSAYALTALKEALKSLRIRASKTAGR